MVGYSFIWNFNGQIKWHQHIIHFIWFTYSWTLINHLLTYLCFRLDRTRRQFSSPAHHLGTFSLSIFISNFQFQVGSYEPTIFNSSLALCLLTSGRNLLIVFWQYKNTGSNMSIFQQAKLSCQWFIGPPAIKASINQTFFWKRFLGLPALLPFAGFSILRSALTWGDIKWKKIIRDGSSTAL